MIRMAEAPTSGLDVGLGAGDRRSAVVVDHRIQAGQAGSGRQEHCQQEEGLDPAKPGLPKERRAVHVPEYTQARSAMVVRRTGPSVGRRNQNAAPLP